MTAASKVCPSCGEHKPASAYHRRTGKRRRELQSWCKSCVSGYGGQAWAAVKVPARLRDLIRAEAEHNQLGIGQLVARAVSQTLRDQCARPGCLAPKVDARHGLCRRCVAEADRRADARAVA